jgi:cytoskeletal protein CcmA (bactofilin family)
MAQEIINYGAAANDGTGDPLRTAFIKTDNNFDQIWAAGPVGSNITVINNTVGVTNTNGNLILMPNGVGAIQTNSRVVPSLTNTYDLGAANSTYRSAYIGSGGLSVAGNVSISGNLSAANVSFSGPVVFPNNVTIEGNLTVNGDTVTVNVSNLAIEDKTIVIANGSPNAASADNSGIIVDGANARITYVSGTNSWVFNKSVVAQNNFTVGNTINNRWNFGLQTNGGFLSFPSGASWRSDIETFDEYITSAVDGYLNFTSIDSTNNLATELNLQHGEVIIRIHNGSIVEWVFFDDGTTFFPGNLIPDTDVSYSLGNVTNQWSDLYVSNATIYMNNVPLTLTAGNVLTVAGQPVLSSNSNTSITTTGTITAGNVITSSIRSEDSTEITVEDGLTVTGDIESHGNITANYFVGNGSQLTGIVSSYGNANVANYLPTFSGNISAGNVSATGNVSGAYVKGNGSELTNLPAPTVTQDISSTGAMSIMLYDGTIKYNNYATVEPSSGNIAAGNISTTGNIAANNFIGLLGNITNLDSLNFTVENISALVGNNGVNIGAGGNNNLVVLPNEVLIQNVPLTVAGNILSTVAGGLNVTANTVANGVAQIWNFGTDGRLTFPGTPRIDTDSNNFEVQAAENISLEANTVVNIYTDSSGNAYQWQFGDDGVLTLPNGAEIRDTAGDAVAIGQQAGETSQGNYAVAMGFQAAISSQGIGAVAIGREAGNAQGAYAVAIGQEAGFAGQSSGAIAIGLEAGNNDQGGDSVAIGYRAGGENQDIYAVAIGYQAGNNTQGGSAVAIGEMAGTDTQGVSAVAVGDGAGRITQGEYAVALGRAAGDTNQGNNSIIINATGGILDQTTANTFTVAPIRNDVANVAEILFYNTTSKEITYGNTISVAGNITGDNLIATGNVTANVVASTNNDGTGQNIKVGDDTWLGDINLSNTLSIRGQQDAANAYIVFGNASNVALGRAGSGPLTYGGDFSVSGNITGNTAGFAIGYRDIPQVGFTGNATIATTDAGKHFYSTESTNYVLTIANNASQGFQVGAAITVVNQGTGTITIAQGSGVTLYLAGNATSGNRTLSTFGMATIMKVATDTWFVNGTGVS